MGVNLTQQEQRLLAVTLQAIERKCGHSQDGKLTSPQDGSPRGNPATQLLKHAWSAPVQAESIVQELNHILHEQAVLASELDMLEQTLGHVGEVSAAAGSPEALQPIEQRPPPDLDAERLAPAASPSMASHPTTNMPEEPVTLTLLQQMREQLRLAQQHQHHSNSLDGSVESSKSSSPSGRPPPGQDPLEPTQGSVAGQQHGSIDQGVKARHTPGITASTTSLQHGSHSKRQLPPSNRQSSTSTTSTLRMRKPYTPSRRPAGLTPQEAALNDMYERDMMAKELLISRQEQFKEVLETYQLAQCTFSPQLSKGTARILARTSPGRQRSSSPGAARAEDAGERLHAVAEQRRQRLQAQLEREQQAVKELRSSYRARSPGRGAQVQPRYLEPRQAAPRHLPTGLDGCTFHPQTNFGRTSQKLTSSSMRALPPAQQEALKAFDDDEAFLAAAFARPLPSQPLQALTSPGRSSSPSPWRSLSSQPQRQMQTAGRRPQSAGPMQGARALPRSGSPGASLSQHQLPMAPWVPAGHEILGGQDSSVYGLSKGWEGSDAGSTGMRSYSNLSHTLDFQEFITRQQAFVEERKQHVEAQRAARPVKPAWISPGSERILKQKQVQSEPRRRHKEPWDEVAQYPFRPQITTRAAQRPAPTLDELVRSTGKVHQNGSDQYRHPSAWKVEGGRHKREAKIAALRYALEVEELSGATFTPQRHTRGWDKVVTARLSHQNLDQYLASVREKKVVMEERRRQAAAEKAARELAECTFSPQTNPLPGYLRQVHVSRIVASMQDGSQRSMPQAEQHHGLHKFTGWSTVPQVSTPTKHAQLHKYMPVAEQASDGGWQQQQQQQHGFGKEQHRGVHSAGHQPAGDGDTTIVLNEQLRSFKERLAELHARLMS